MFFTPSIRLINCKKRLNDNFSVHIPNLVINKVYDSINIILLLINKYVNLPSKLEDRNDEGHIESLFYFTEMIKKQTIIDLIDTHFQGTDKFIVDVKVLADNVVEIYIDAPNHILIADCVELSRFVEGSLDREKDDFELQVSSPGATEPFKVVNQYKKYIGTKVKVTTKEGVKHEGVLKNANENEFVIEETTREKKVVGKGNETIVKDITLAYNQTKETKSVLPF